MIPRQSGEGMCEGWADACGEYGKDASISTWENREAFPKEAQSYF